MLKIAVPATDLFDETKSEFIYTKGCELQLEHSLVSIAKWESKYNRAFLSKVPKTVDETLYYIQCMTITQNVNPHVYDCITDQAITKINQYITAPMTAVHFIDEEESGATKNVITSELIYSWMIDLGIPFECQRWHLNRLLTLIKVHSMRHKQKKKRSSKDIMSRNAALNAARRQKYNSKG